MVRARRDPGPDDGRTICLALLVDAGPWMKSRVAPGSDHADRRDRVKRIRSGKQAPPAHTTFLDCLGVARAPVRTGAGPHGRRSARSPVCTVVDATRLAVRNSRAAW